MVERDIMRRKTIIIKYRTKISKSKFSKLVSHLSEFVFVEKNRISSLFSLILNTKSVMFIVGVEYLLHLAISNSHSQRRRSQNFIHCLTSLPSFPFPTTSYSFVGFDANALIVNK